MNSAWRTLSKSAYKDGRKCAKRLYLRWHEPQLRALDEGMEMRAELGRQVGELARGLNPGGEIVEARSLEERADITQQLIREGHSIIYEAAFLADDLFAQVDILFRVADGWVIREVKSSKTVSDDHLFDVAFQVLVAEKSGLEISSAQIATISREAPMIESAAVSQLFSITDSTEKVRELIPQVESEIEGLKNQIESGQAVQILAGKHCDSDCPFTNHCFAGFEDDDLMFVPGIVKKRFDDLQSRGIRRLSDLPTDETLPPTSEFVRNAFASGEVPWVSRNLKQELERIKFPAVFLDFETARPMFPLDPGFKGGELIVFQWSAHVLSEPGGHLAHFEYIDLESANPHPRCVDELNVVLAGAGSVVHYSGFERTVLRELDKRGVFGAKELLSRFEECAVDLQDYFKQQVYHPAFRGKSSIKVVLPIMVPGLSYDDLEVKGGGVAEMSYILARQGVLQGDELAKRRKALLEYCKRDTLAMVKLYEVLLELAYRN
ncbi:MAG: DUF2779 domain-containing protein [Fimbriimonadaceae bacterium]|nr:MAG: DUF2779 domain-containing protein [Fimbriimonadaceae bacterium]